MTATVGHADAVSTQAQQNNNTRIRARKRPIPTRPAQPEKERIRPADAPNSHSTRRMPTSVTQKHKGQRQWARARFSRARFPVNWRAHRSRMRAATPRMSLSVARKHNLAKTTTVGHAVVGRTQAQKTTIPHGSGRGSARFPLDWAQLKTQAGPADAPGSTRPDALTHSNVGHTEAHQGKNNGPGRALRARIPVGWTTGGPTAVACVLRLVAWRRESRTCITKKDSRL